MGRWPGTSFAVRSLASGHLLEWSHDCGDSVLLSLGGLLTSCALLCPPLEGPKKHFSILNPKPFLKPKARTPSQRPQEPKSSPSRRRPSVLATFTPHTQQFDAPSPLPENKSHTQDYNTYPDERVSRWKEKAPGISLLFYSSCGSNFLELQKRSFPFPFSGGCAPLCPGCLLLGRDSLPSSASRSCLHCASVLCVRDAFWKPSEEAGGACFTILSLSSWSPVPTDSESLGNDLPLQSQTSAVADSNPERGVCACVHACACACVCGASILALHSKYGMKCSSVSSLMPP